MKNKLLSALIICALLPGCASLCDPSDKQCQKSAKEDDKDVGAGIILGLDIIGSLDQPQTTTTTKTCTKDRRGDESCTTTQQGSP